MTDFDPADLTKEKSLFDVYRLCRRLPRRPSRTVFESCVLALLVLYAAITDESTSILAERVRVWADTGFAFSVAILGFLLAGFTIFATMTRMDLAVEMAKTIHKRTGLSYLKYNFAAFLSVFIKYLAFVAAYICLRLFAAPGGLVSIVLGEITETPQLEKRIIVLVGIVGVGFFLMHLVVTLSAFVFNVYHAVMTAIRWEIERGDNTPRVDDSEEESKSP